MGERNDSIKKWVFLGLCIVAAASFAFFLVSYINYNQENVSEGNVGCNEGNPTEETESQSSTPTFANQTLSPTIENETSSPTLTEQPIRTGFDILDVYPHDETAFTQGLLYFDGYLYESTGGTSRRSFASSLRKVEIETGEIISKVLTLDAVNNRADYFAEGLCKIGNKLHQLTWQGNVFLTYDFDSFELLDETEFITTRNEGWGFAYTDDLNYFTEPQLVVSDGSSILHFWDPITFEEIRTIQVRDKNKNLNIQSLNELEFVKGEILANIWYNDQIVRICPNTGEVLGYYDFSFDNLPIEPHGNVLNGIAYDSETDETYITGKLWKYMLKVKLYQ